MASGENVEQDDMAALKDGSLYLGFAYEHSDGQYTPFEYFEIGRKGKLKNTELTNPWENIADVKFTYEKELAGGGAIPMPELTKIKMNFVSQYGEELFYPTDFNYKILANEFVTSEEYANISTFSLDKMEKADNNTDQPYFEIIAYPNDSKDTVSIRYDAETGDAIAWSKEVND